MVTMGVERFIARPLVELLWLVAALLVAVDALGRTTELDPSVERARLDTYEPDPVRS
jgi:hypothetical protein